MNSGRPTVVVLCIALLITLTAGASAVAAPLDDVDGKQWRQLYETTGASWSEVSQVCPRDGATPCSGSIGATDVTGWVWATAAQVMALFAHYEPGVLAETPPSSDAWFGTASAFLTDMRWTGYYVLYGGYFEWTAGWTASTDEVGLPLAASVSYGWWPPAGSFGTYAAADVGTSDRGVFLWRPVQADSTAPPPPVEEPAPPPADPTPPPPDPTPPPPQEPSPPADSTPPTITASVNGTTGSNGWFVSDVSVTWTVTDGESSVSSASGCDATTVAADAAAVTLTCEATSEGGTASASTVVKRDATAPTIACDSAPVFQMHQAGAAVTATVSDDTSGAAAPSATANAPTGSTGSFAVSVSGSDAAGNQSSQLCDYTVAVPTCNGLAATRVGTNGNDSIEGTSGRDVIVGLGGNDRIRGAEGDDVICGGAGSDELEGGDGDDYVDGGDGSDSVRGDKGRDTCLSAELRRSSCEA